MKDSLFVYGTLMPNCPNSYVLENIVGKFVPATVKGKLIDAGWSASMGYPGIRLEMGNDTIHGFLFYSDNLINHWENLDIFEGVEFSRTPVIVERYDEVEVQTYIYTLKDEIIEMYLNNSYFGNGVWGVEDASQKYFGKSAADVTLSEAATIAGMLKAPSNYNPIDNYDNAISRRNVVLDLMATNELVTQEEVDELKAQELTLVDAYSEKEGYQSKEDDAEEESEDY